MVKKKFIMRKLIDAAEHIGALGYEESNEVEHILDSASKKLFEVTNFSGSGQFTALGDALEEAFERLDRLHQNPNEVRGVPTGFRQLDNKLSGFQNSDLIILAARPSCGKTSLALDFVRHAAIQKNIPTLFFSLEMSTQQLVDRMLAAEAKVDAWRLRTGKLDMETEFTLLQDKLSTLSQAPIYVDDQPANNIMKMRSAARRLKMEKGLGLIVVDYLQLMAPVNTKSSESMVNQVTEISRSLKQLAKEMNVPVIALSQLSRAVEQRGGKPRLSDLRDSGSIEQDADVVMFIHKEEKYNEEIGKATPVEILIEKHRNGPTGKVDLMFNSVQSTFIEPDPSFASFQKDVANF
jgi:replicative DNA helicase